MYVLSCSSEQELTISCPIYLSGWLAAKSVRLFLDKNYRYHFLSMLGHDPPTNQCLDTVNSSRRRGNREEDGGVVSNAGGDEVDMEDGGEEGIGGGVATEERGMANDEVNMDDEGIGGVDMDQEGCVAMQEEETKEESAGGVEQDTSDNQEEGRGSCVGVNSGKIEDTVGTKDSQQDTTVMST